MDKTFKAKNGSIRLTDDFIEISKSGEVEAIHYDKIDNVYVSPKSITNPGYLGIKTEDGKERLLSIGLTDTELFIKIKRKICENAKIKNDIESGVVEDGNRRIYGGEIEKTSDSWSIMQFILPKILPFIIIPSIMFIVWIMIKIFQ